MPTSHKYSWQNCRGAHIVYTGKKFNPTELSYKIIQYLFKNYPETRWSYSGDRYEIDSMSGTDKFRLSINQGLSFEEYFKLVEDEINEFSKKRKKYILY